MDALLQDLKFAAKLLIKEKVFALTAILTLGLVIGANTTIFTVVDSVLLEPLPVPDAERLVYMYNSFPGAGAERGSTSVTNYVERLEQVDVFVEQALYRFGGRALGEGGTPERASAMTVTPSFFRLLQVKPRLGRNFTEDEGEIGNHEKVILSHALHQQLYSGSESVLGRELHIDGRPHEIVGVMAEDFFFLDPEVRLFVAAAFTDEQKLDRFSHNWNMIGRLKEGASIEQARQQLDALNAATIESLPEFKEMLLNAGFSSKAVSFQKDLVRDVERTLYLLWGGVFFVLLIGCVNVANLVLVRSTVRMKELTTRVALGAGRRRVTRQLLTESVLMTLCGGLLGLGLGWGGIRALSLLDMDQFPRGVEIGMNPIVAVATLALAFVLGLGIGVIPVVHLFRVDVSAVLREGGRSGTSGRGTRIVRRALVMGQVAIALVLLVGAGLLLASFQRVLAIDPGFEPEGLLTAFVSLPSARYENAEDRRAFAARAVERLNAIPGARVAGVTSNLPFGRSYSDSVIMAEGYQMKPGESIISPSNIAVSPGYMEAMGMRHVSGRLIDERDVDGAPRVAVIDDRLARYFWGDEDPVGRRMYRPNGPEDLLAVPENAEWITVVGVVEEVKMRGLTDTDARFGAYYLPLAQQNRGALGLALRAGVEPTSLIGSVRREIAALDPEMPVFDTLVMADRVAQSLVTRRSPMLLTLAGSALALFLASLGIYGVLAYLVTRRSKEIGIRLALGSSGRGIFRLVIREGIAIVGVGVGLGLALAVALSRGLESQLYGVEASDPLVLAAVIGVLAAVAFCACLVPAFRATRIDPVVALHEQ